jgi:hypothetical protein
VNPIAKGLAYLDSVQQSRGSFRTYSSPSERPFVHHTAYVTTFSQAIMLAALTAVPDESAAVIRKRLAGWLLKQRSDHWSFNYWPRGSATSKRQPYPDDLDDTFCALLALWLYDPKLIDGACLGHAVKLLIATESQPGGPYRTWLVPADSDPLWLDIDVAVNANIACFIRHVAGPLPNVVALLERAIADKKLASPYYPSAYPLAYYLARAYRGPEQSQLAELLLGMARDGHWGTPLQTALAVSSLVQLGRSETCQAAVDFLHTSQQADGSWPAEAFCIDPAQNGQQFFNGAPALTTALVVEALARYDQAAAQDKPAAARLAPKESAAQALKTAIYNTVENELRQLPSTLAAQSRPVIERIQSRDERSEISLLPVFFKTALKTPPAWADQAKLLDLGKANLYGWMAYTLYDDFLDGSRGPELLGVANAAGRRSLNSFRACLPDHTAFWELVEQTFDCIDNANSWELANCRFIVSGGFVTIAHLPNYGQRLKLCERSLGHTLTPLAILMSTGLTLSHPSVRRLKRGLAHYIIARQLNDDLHDWEEDLSLGQASYVVCELLRAAHVSPGSHSLAELIPLLRQQLWHHSVQPLCNTVTAHLDQSRRALIASGLFTPKNDLFGLLERLEAGVQKTLQEQRNAEAFILSYGE